MVNCKHLDCKYRDSHDKDYDCCKYILIEGHRRPCPAGDCPGVYAPKEGYKPVQSFFGLGRRTGVEELVSEEQLWDKYDAGWGDGRIAGHFGIPVRAVKDWRNSNGLPLVSKREEQA